MIRIDTPEDWGKLRREGLLTVLDPLIVQENDMARALASALTTSDSTTAS